MVIYHIYTDMLWICEYFFFSNPPGSDLDHFYRHVTAQSVPNPASTSAAGWRCMLATETALFTISEPDDQVSAVIKDLELMLKDPCTPRPSSPETQPVGNCSKASLSLPRAFWRYWRGTSFGKGSSQVSDSHYLFLTVNFQF